MLSPEGIVFMVLIALLIIFSPDLSRRSRPLSVSDLWDELLRKYRSEGEINGVVTAVLDYAAIKGDPLWSELLEALETSTEPLDAAGQKAYWINAFNILTVKQVLARYPVASIADIQDFWTSEAGHVYGEPRTLKEIETRELAPLSDPRIAATIGCVAVSAPDLRGEAYRPEKLDEQLDDQLRRLMANPRKCVQAQAGVEGFDYDGTLNANVRG